MRRRFRVFEKKQYAGLCKQPSWKIWTISSCAQVKLELVYSRKCNEMQNQKRFNSPSTCAHRRSQGTTPSEFLAYPIVLCLERRCPTKQNTVVCLKSKYLPPQTCGLATLLLRFGMTQKVFCQNNWRESGPLKIDQHKRTAWGCTDKSAITRAKIFKIWAKCTATFTCKWGSVYFPN